MHGFFGPYKTQNLSRFLTLFLVSGSLWPALAVVGPSITAVVNLASFDTRLTPGEPATIFGMNLGPSVTSVLVGGQAATVLSATNTQVNFQVPVGLPVGATTVTLTASPGGPSAPFPIVLTAYAPSFFHSGSLATGPVFATHANGFQITTGSPALASEVVSFFMAGLGSTIPLQPVGPTPGGVPYLTITTPVFLVNGVSSQVVSSALAPGTYGYYQVYVRIPANAPTGQLTVSASIGGSNSDSGTIYVNVPYSVGFFQPNGPTWALDSNGSGAYEASDKVFAFAGQPGAIAVTGDWNGDGHTKVGYYLNGFWVLDYNGNGVYDGTGPGGDKFYAFGGSGPGFVPVTGDWNGDGTTKIGYYHNGFWALDTNGSGTFDAGDGFYGFGGNGAGEIPVVGDWNGDHRSKVGFFFQGLWVLDYDGNGTFTSADKYYNTFPYSAGDIPVFGDWTGDGKTKIGIYRNGFWILDANNNGTYDGIAFGQDKFYGFGGSVGDLPVAADWNGSGTTKIGVYNNGFWVLDYNGNGSYDGTGPGGDRFVAFGGQAGNQPIIGRW